MADGATIDPLSIHSIFNGSRISGYAPGTFINVVYDVDTFSSIVGVDGEGAWFKSANLKALITMTLMQSSQSNDILSAAHLLDKNTPNGLMGPYVLREQNGTTLYAAARARVIKLPDAAWSDSVESRAWAIGTTKLEGFVGGLLATPLV